MFDKSLEAMQAQIQSRLGKELDAIWQEIIDFRDQSTKDMSYAGKLSALKKFFREKTAKKFIACVWKNVGLKINEVQVVSLMQGSFACASFFDPQHRDDFSGWLQINETLNGEYYKKCFPLMISMMQNHTIDPETLIKIAQGYDASRGVIHESMRMKMRSLVNATIFFDVETAFMMEDQLPANAGIGQFSAQEITGIMLHELGHTINLVEHAADMYARIATFKYLESAFRSVNGNNMEATAQLAESVATMVEKRGDKQNADRIRDIVKRAHHDVGFTGSAAKSDKKSCLIGSIIAFCFCFISDIFAIPIDVIFGGNQKNRFSNDQKVKKGDIPINWNMVTWNERHADGYAMSHGYGTAIVSGLDKLGKFLQRRGMTEKQIATLQEAETLHKDLGFFTKVGLIVMAPLVAGNFQYMLYPEGVKRFREILNLSIQQLKANATDPAYVNKYMKDIEFILNKIENPNREDEYQAKLFRGYDIFMKFVSLPSFVDWLVHGRVKREIEEVLMDANAAGNSLLTYYGFKLQQLGNK